MYSCNSCTEQVRDNFKNDKKNVQVINKQNSQWETASGRDEDSLELKRVDVCPC